MSEESENKSLSHLVDWLKAAESIADLVAGLTFVAAQAVHAIEHPEEGKAAGPVAYALIETWINAGGGRGQPAGVVELAAVVQCVALSLRNVAEGRLSQVSDRTLKPRACAHHGCERPATHIVGLLIRPPRGYGDSESRAYLDMVMCPDHAAVVSVRDIVGDQMWSQISAGFVSAGKVEPDRGRTASFSEPIDEAPEIFRSRYEPRPSDPA